MLIIFLQQSLQTVDVDIDDDIVVVLVYVNQAFSSPTKMSQNNIDTCSTPIPCTKSKKVVANDSGSGKQKYGNSPLPNPLPFPSNFSIAVQQAIDKGSVLPVRRQLISDIGLFYFGLTSHPQQGDYKRIALLICEKFPELRDTTP